MLSDGHICRSAIEIVTYKKSGAAMCGSRTPWVGKITRVRRTNQVNDPGSVFDLNRQTTEPRPSRGAKSAASVSVSQPT
jgi:hypothetical protein